jgi:acetyl-CoA carboxylase carboxyl transferase subunit alpha
MTAYERVNAARAKGRPTSAAFIEGIFTNFIELHGDRGFCGRQGHLGWACLP